jgi:hypothetical protein
VTSKGSTLAATRMPNIFKTDNGMADFWTTKLTGIAQSFDSYVRRVTTSSTYHSFGRRMSKSINGTTTQFLYDRLNPMQELNPGNQVTANLLTELRVDEYFTHTDKAASTFLADALGSTIRLMEAGGTLVTK